MQSLTGRGYIVLPAFPVFPRSPGNVFPFFRTRSAREREEIRANLREVTANARSDTSSDELARSDGFGRLIRENVHALSGV